MRRIALQLQCAVAASLWSQVLVLEAAWADGGVTDEAVTRDVREDGRGRILLGVCDKTGVALAPGGGWWHKHTGGEDLSLPSFNALNPAEKAAYVEIRNANDLGALRESYFVEIPMAVAVMRYKGLYTTSGSHELDGYYSQSENSVRLKESDNVGFGRRNSHDVQQDFSNMADLIERERRSEPVVSTLLRYMRAQLAVLARPSPDCPYRAMIHTVDRAQRRLLLWDRRELSSDELALHGILFTPDGDSLYTRLRSGEENSRRIVIECNSPGAVVSEGACVLPPAFVTGTRTSTSPLAADEGLRKALISLLMAAMDAAARMMMERGESLMPPLAISYQPTIQTVARDTHLLTTGSPVSTATLSSAAEVSKDSAVKKSVVQALMDAFKEIDHSQDGKVQLVELNKAARGEATRPGVEAYRAILRLFRGMDADGDRGVTEAEFLAAVAPHGANALAWLREIFPQLVSQAARETTGRGRGSEMPMSSTMDPSPPAVPGELARYPDREASSETSAGLGPRAKLGMGMVDCVEAKVGGALSADLVRQNGCPRYDPNAGGPALHSADMCRRQSDRRSEADTAAGSVQQTATKAGTEDGLEYERRRNVVEGDPSRLKLAAELAESLANRGYKWCRSWCVYSLRRPARVAWMWNSEEYCWMLDDRCLEFNDELDHVKRVSKHFCLPSSPPTSSTFQDLPNADEERSPETSGAEDTFPREDGMVPISNVGLRALLHRAKHVLEEGSRTSAATHAAIERLAFMGPGRLHHAKQGGKEADGSRGGDVWAAQSFPITSHKPTQLQESTLHLPPGSYSQRAAVFVSSTMSGLQDLDASLDEVERWLLALRDDHPMVSKGDVTVIGAAVANAEGLISEVHAALPYVQKTSSSLARRGQSLSELYETGRRLLRLEEERLSLTGSADMPSLTRAVALLRRLVLKGHAGAAHALGRAHHLCIHPECLGSVSVAVREEHIRVGIALYEAAASRGHARSQYDLSNVLRYGLYNHTADRTRAALLTAFAAAGGSPEAQMAIGMRWRRPETNRVSGGEDGSETAELEDGVCEVALGNLAAAASSMLQQHSDLEAKLSFRRYGDPMVRLSEDVTNHVWLSKNDRELLDFYAQMAESEANIQALMILTSVHVSGLRHVVRSNIDIAKTYLEKAVSLGATSAYGQLGLIHLYGLGSTPQDNRTALDYFTRGAAKGNAGSFTGLGIMKMRGMVGDPSYELQGGDSMRGRRESSSNVEQVPEDRVRDAVTNANVRDALHYFDKAVRISNNPVAHYHIGMLHSHQHRQGRSLPFNFTLAAAHFHMAISQRHPLSHLGIARLLMAIGSNCKSAAEHMRRFLARSGYSHVLSDGLERFVAGDATSAVWHYLDAARRGFGIGAFNAAYIVHHLHADNSTSYRFGIGSNGYGSNARKATRRPELPLLGLPADAGANVHELYFESIAMGTSEAWIQLGDLFFYAVLGTSHDLAAAAEMYTAAAAAGIPQGMYNRGFMHEHGLGVKQDLPLAKRYYDEILHHPRGPLSVWSVAICRLTFRNAIGNIEDHWAWQQWLRPAMTKSAEAVSKWASAGSTKSAEKHDHGNGMNWRARLEVWFVEAVEAISIWLTELSFALEATQIAVLGTTLCAVAAVRAARTFRQP